MSERDWRGCSLPEIYGGLNEWELQHFPPIRPSDNHKVLFELPFKSGEESPKPYCGDNKWDSQHVRLPCSRRNQYPVINPDGSETLQTRWDIIQMSLLKPIANSREFEAAVLSYNTKYQRVWQFTALHRLFEVELDHEEVSAFFRDTLPKIIALALRLPELVPNAIPLLMQGINYSLSLSCLQVASLLANAFLCTFPRRNTQKRKSEYSSFPSINFNGLFQADGPCVMEKIRCICHYFTRVCKKTPVGVITIVRRCLKKEQFPDWSRSEAPMSAGKVHITSSGTIEDQGENLLQVDFANKFLGGGVLGHGCVQEEIRFVICPELFVTKLVTESLKKEECLFVVGCERFSQYSGYASSFAWEGDFIDETPFDCSGRRQCTIVAIDALCFHQPMHQYHSELIRRELNKAYVGFLQAVKTPAPAVASGNWGCGAFGGDIYLKALIQLMACVSVPGGRPLVYFTFGDRKLLSRLEEMYQYLRSNHMNVSQIYRYLCDFKSERLPPNQLYSYIQRRHNALNINPRVMPVVSNQSAKEEPTQILGTPIKISANPENSPKAAVSSPKNYFGTKIFDSSNSDLEENSLDDELLSVVVDEVEKSFASTPTAIKPPLPPSEEESCLSLLENIYHSEKPQSKRHRSSVIGASSSNGNGSDYPLEPGQSNLLDFFTRK